MLRESMIDQFKAVHGEASPDRFPGGLPPTRCAVLWIARFSYAPNQRLAVHAHDFHQLMVVLDGDGTFFGPEGNSPIAPGRSWLLWPGRTHGLVAGDRGVDTLDVKFLLDSSVLERRLDQLAAEVATPVRLRDHLERALAEAAAGGSMADAACALDVLAGLVELLRGSGPKPAPDPPEPAGDPLVGATRRWLREHLAEPVTPARLARAIGYTYRHLANRTRAVLGVTPLMLLERERIAAAVELLRWSDHPLHTIALRTGFADQARFSKVFSRHLGQPPGRFRADHQRGIGGVTVAQGFRNEDRRLGNLGDLT